MRSMIFDTQGTGFYKRAVRQMMDQKEATYLSGPGGGLGDEIMLLEGLDDLGAMYPHGYDDGPARTYTMPTMDRGTTYDFSTGPVDTGISGARLGASMNDNQGAWPRMADPRWRYTGLGAQPGWPRQQSRYAQRKFRFTGPGVSGLRGASIRRGRYSYTGLQGGLGDAQSDARTALAIAQTTLSLARAACGAISNASDRTTCERTAQVAFDTARAAIIAGYGTDGTYAPPSGTPSPSAATQEQIDEKLRMQAERSGVEPPASVSSSGSSDMMLIGGIVVAGLIGAYVIMNR